MECADFYHIDYCQQNKDKCQIDDFHFIDNCRHTCGRCEGKYQTIQIQRKLKIQTKCQILVDFKYSYVNHNNQCLKLDLEKKICEVLKHLR